MNSVSMKACNSQSLRDAAFSYPGTGYKILSLKPQIKEAESSGWSNPEDLDNLIHWASPGCRNNNIGMPLGRNRCYVIDIDCKPEYMQTVEAVVDPLVQATGDELSEEYWDWVWRIIKPNPDEITDYQLLLRKYENIEAIRTHESVFFDVLRPTNEKIPKIP